MATLTIPDENRVLHDADEINAVLQPAGVTYERWEPAHPIAPDATPDEILAAYSPEIDRLKSEGGYVTADVIDVKPDTPNLEALLNKFNKEHWHDEDEVRFVIEGRGLFHLHPEGHPVMAVTVEAGDLLRVPRGMHHWFDLCTEKRIRAIRLFQDASGWTPHYTESGVDGGYQPVCFNPSQVGGERIRVEGMPEIPNA